MPAAPSPSEDAGLRDPEAVLARLAPHRAGGGAEAGAEGAVEVGQVVEAGVIGDGGDGAHVLTVLARQQPPVGKVETGAQDDGAYRLAHGLEMPLQRAARQAEAAGETVDVETGFAGMAGNQAAGFGIEALALAILRCGLPVPMMEIGTQKIENGLAERGLGRHIEREELGHDRAHGDAEWVGG